MHSHDEGNIFPLQLHVSIEDRTGMKTTVLYFPLISLCSTSTCPSISPSLSPVSAPPAVAAAAVCLPRALWRRWCGAVLMDRGRGSNCTAKKADSALQKPAERLQLMLYFPATSLFTGVTAKCRPEDTFKTDYRYRLKLTIRTPYRNTRLISGIKGPLRSFGEERQMFSMTEIILMPK